MAESRRTFRVSLETKVMVAVLAVLVVLPTVTLWLVDRQDRRQMGVDAARAREAAQMSFASSLQVRADALERRFRTAVNDSRFLRIVGLNDVPTMEGYLKTDVLDEFHEDTEIALFVPADGGDIRSARQADVNTNPGGFATAADSVIRAAFKTERPQAGIVGVEQVVYQVIAIPVAPRGALVFGIRLGDAELRKLQPPEAEVVILNDHEIVASTLSIARRNDPALLQFVRANAPQENGSEMMTVGGERYLPAVGVVDPAAPQIRYVLLSSVEQRIRAFEQTRMTLIALSIAGILVSALIVWIFVRRITHPLVELRDTAEAVGRGDFSRRIEKFSNDECGELAEAFNRMTSNLQTSRAELENAMQQVRTTQEQLIQREKLSAVGQFVAGVAHELNNPLTAVVGFSELLQSMPIDDKIRSHLDRIAKSAHRCHKIVHSLLSFARQDAPERKLVQLHTVVDEVLEIMAYDLRTSDITIVREFAGSLPPILADPHQLQQVFVNILGNARQAMEPYEGRGRIVIRTRQTGKSVVLEFEDNGPGIRPEHLARIFDPFFTTKPVGKGTGLGLSLCYGIIQEHGGTITARSELGQGATFAIELPVATNVPSAVVERTGNSAVPFPITPRPPSGKTVLVIDDEEWILDLARELLRGEGHEVQTALGGQEAIELLGRRKFDAILSDWKMPGLNGVRLYEHLRNADPAAAHRVLFMTGDVVNDTFQNFLREHELACLSKPFATGEFRAAVAKIFSSNGK